MPDDDRPMPADALTNELLYDRLLKTVNAAPVPDEVGTIEGLLTRYVNAHRVAGRVRVARALGLNVVCGDDNDPELLAIALHEAVGRLPEFNAPAATPSSPVSAPAGDAGPDAPPPPPAPAAGAAAPDDGERIVVSEALRVKLNARATVYLFGGVPVPKTLKWMRDTLRANVEWVSGDNMPSRPLFNPTRDAAVVLLQGLLGHGDMDALVEAAKAAGVPFARVNMPGRGELRRAVEIIDRWRVAS